MHRTESEINSFLSSIREKSLWVKPTDKVRACSDPSDDIFLECAQAAGAQYLVTGNGKHFPPNWGATQIVTARQFLDALL